MYSMMKEGDKVRHCLEEGVFVIIKTGINMSVIENIYGERFTVSTSLLYRA